MKNQKTCFNCLWFNGIHWDTHTIMCNNPPLNNNSDKTNAIPCINWQEQISLELAEEILNAEARNIQSL